MLKKLTLLSAEATVRQRDTRAADEPGEEVVAPRAEQLHARRVRGQPKGRAQLRARQEQGTTPFSAVVTHVNGVIFHTTGFLCVTVTMLGNQKSVAVLRG